MAKYTGGMQVAGGYYWNTGNWEVEVISAEGGRLRGGAKARYVKVPFPALFVIVPLLGALFLMFLPLIGFALFAYAIAKKVTGAVKKGATELASTVHPGGFATGNAYFTGKPEEKKEGASEARRAASSRRSSRRSPRARRPEVAKSRRAGRRGRGTRPRSHLDGFRIRSPGRRDGASPLAAGGGITCGDPAYRSQTADPLVVLAARHAAQRASKALRSLWSRAAAKGLDEPLRLARRSSNRALASARPSSSAGYSSR